MSIALYGITWGALQNLAMVVPICLLAVAVVLYRTYRSKKALRELSFSRFARLFLFNVSPRKLYIKTVLFSIGILFLLITLLHPQWDKKEETVMQQGRDLFIALDVSRSMLAKDCLPSRLACAKAKIKELVKSLSCERVGLLLFSGSAFVQCPLTADYGAFFMFLDQVDVETIASGTTALDAVIKKVLDMYRLMEARKTKLLIVFTDGEDFSSNLSQVKQQAQAQQVKIITLGVGTPEGAPIPMIDEHSIQVGHIQDKKGAVVISRLNEGILHTVAQDCGGVYVRMSDGSADVKTVIGHVNSFEKEELGDKRFARLEEQYPYFLLVSFICFLCEWLL